MAVPMATVEARLVEGSHKDMSKLRRLVVLLIFGLSTLVVIGNARSFEQRGSNLQGNLQGEFVPAVTAAELTDQDRSG